MDAILDSGDHSLLERLAQGNLSEAACSMVQGA